jgi:hypothetical protein
MGAAVLEEELWRLAPLSAGKTGLPFIVWISSGQGVRHAARVKVARDMADLANSALPRRIIKARCGCGD